MRRTQRRFSRVNVILGAIIKANTKNNHCNALDSALSETNWSHVTSFWHRSKLFENFSSEKKFLEFLANRLHLYEIDGRNVKRRGQRHRDAIKFLWDDMEAREWFTLEMIPAILGKFSPGFTAVALNNFFA